MLQMLNLKCKIVMHKVAHFFPFSINPNPESEWFTVFENHPKHRILIFNFGLNFSPVKTDLSGNSA